MAHHRERYLKKYVLDSLRFSPLVGVLGQRQTGKTTLLESLPNSIYDSLDDDARLQFARLKPKSYLESFSKLTSIDECQKSPELFPALKLHVQKDKRPGQFVLSGSVRFTSKKAIQESLTGRIINLELLPMSLAETQHLPPLDYLTFFNQDLSILVPKCKQRADYFADKTIEKFKISGGLPGICFLREESHRRNKFKSHIETLLQRDIRQISNTTLDYQSLLGLLTHIAETEGKPFQVSEAAKTTRLAQNTIKSLLQVFEGLFLIRRVRGLGFRSAPMFYLEDLGMSNYLKISPAHKSSFIFNHLFSNIHYTYMNQYEVGHYETKSGSRFDLVARVEKHFLGFIYEDSETPSSSTLSVADNFIKANPQGLVILANEADTLTRLDKNLIVVPKRWLI